MKEEREVVERIEKQAGRNFVNKIKHIFEDFLESAELESELKGTSGKKSK